MKYVWLIQFVIVVLFKINKIWLLQEGTNFFGGNGYDYSLSKMSKVCSFLAESCGKCTELKACFWCSDEESGPGNCYAKSDAVARQRCAGKIISYWKKPCAVVSNKNVLSNIDSERSVLIKLLLLLRKLRDSQKNKSDRNAWHTDNSNKNEISELIKGTTLPNHSKSMGDMSNKELKKTIGILTNTSSSFISSLNIVHNSSINQIQNLSSLILHYANTTSSRTITTTNTSQNNASLNFEFENNTNVNKGKDNTTLFCINDNNFTCINKHYCSWCKNNTCCSKGSEEKIKTDKIIKFSPGNIQNETTLQCSDRLKCDECVADISCYWCQEATSCRKYPGKSYVNEECKSGVSHQTCAQQIPIYAIAIWIILITFFVSVGYVCVQKCYYFQLKPVEVKLEERPILFKQKNGRTVYQITESEEEDEELIARTGKDTYTPSKVGSAPNNPAVW